MSLHQTPCLLYVVAGEENEEGEIARARDEGYYYRWWKGSSAGRKHSPVLYLVEP